MKAHALFFAGATLLLAGCSRRLEAITMDPLTSSPLDASVTQDKIETFEGTGLAVRIQAYTEDPRQASDPNHPPQPEDVADVHVTSENDQVLQVHRVKGATYILTATAPGHTRLRVSDDSADGEILVDVLVSAQTP